MIKWQEVKLGDVCTQITDGVHNTVRDNSNGDCFLLSCKNLKNGQIVIGENERKIDLDTLQNLRKRTKTAKGDVLLSSVGTIGETAIIKENNPKYEFQRSVAIFKPNKTYITSEFLFYCLNNNKALLQHNAEGAVQQCLFINPLKEFMIHLPPLEVQKKIAGVLGALDDKIELNNKINQNLETQAQALFKSWFIDFEPFGGKMPDDWKTGKLKDIIKLKRNTIKAGENSQLPYLPIDVIPMNSLAINEVKANSEAQSSLITFEKDDILIGAMRVYFHRVIIAPCAGITRTTCFVLSPFKKEFLSYAILLCNQNSSIEFAQKTSKGSTMPYAIWEGGLGELDVPIPSQEIAEKFNNIIFPLIKQIQNSYFENTQLAGLRDTLLPKLMSGEINVDDVKID